MNDPVSFNQWVRDHKVCFEVGPFHSLHNGKMVQVGFELHLYAQHQDSKKADPGCVECYRLYQQLQRIARLVMPQEIRPSRYEIAAFDSSFQLRQETRMKEEVQLVMLVLHRDTYLDPVDECEKRCIAEIQQQLKQMGVPPHVWQEKSMAVS